MTWNSFHAYLQRSVDGLPISVVRPDEMIGMCGRISNTFLKEFPEGLQCESGSDQSHLIDIHSEARNPWLAIRRDARFLILEARKSSWLMRLRVKNALQAWRFSG